MRRLFHIVQLFKEYFIVASLIIVSIALMTENDNQQIHQIRALSIGILGRIQESVSFLPNFFRLEKENEVLRRTNVDLADEVNQLREAKLENIRLRSLLGLKETTKFELIPAKVVGKTLDLLRNTITLNVGEKDGVAPGMPIISDAGLVGKIIAVGGSYAMGQIILNSDFRASARIQRSRVDGILAWKGGKNSLLKDVAKTRDVKVGDMVETSEYSSLFPPNIRIGVVALVTEQPGDLFKTIEIENAVDFTTLEEVFVMNAKPDSTRIRFEERVLR
ncbi:MAG: rod shape-determining protein MreC [Bacteroidota bacterium]